MWTVTIVYWYNTFLFIIIRAFQNKADLIQPNHGNENFTTPFKAYLNMRKKIISHILLLWWSLSIQDTRDKQQSMLKSRYVFVHVLDDDYFCVHYYGKIGVPQGVLTNWGLINCGCSLCHSFHTLGHCLGGSANGVCRERQPKAMVNDSFKDLH